MLSRLPHAVPYQGSKRSLAPIIGRYLPNTIHRFYEPFAGSAAMTIYAAYHNRAERFIVADSLEPMVTLLRSIVEEPKRTAAKYREVWEGQRDGEQGYFNEVRDRYNNEGDPVDLLYLICRCVKNAICQRRSNFRPARRSKSRPVVRWRFEAKSPLREGGFLLFGGFRTMLRRCRDRRPRRAAVHRPRDPGLSGGGSWTV
jgi:hypothetical protein